jgi:hypothetical protein
MGPPPWGGPFLLSRASGPAGKRRLCRRSHTLVLAEPDAAADVPSLHGGSFHGAAYDVGRLAACHRGSRGVPFAQLPSELNVVPALGRRASAVFPTPGAPVIALTGLTDVSFSASFADHAARRSFNWARNDSLLMKTAVPLGNWRGAGNALGFEP